MSYKQEFASELGKMLKSSQTAESIISWVWEKHLESYKNGIKAGRNGETVKRQGKSRSRDAFTQAE